MNYFEQILSDALRKQMIKRAYSQGQYNAAPPLDIYNKRLRGSSNTTNGYKVPEPAKLSKYNQSVHTYNDLPARTPMPSPPPMPSTQKQYPVEQNQQMPRPTNPIADNYYGSNRSRQAQPYPDVPLRYYDDASLHRFGLNEEAAAESTRRAHFLNGSGIGPKTEYLNSFTPRESYLRRLNPVRINSEVDTYRDDDNPYRKRLKNPQEMIDQLQYYYPDMMAQYGIPDSINLDDDEF